MKKIIPFAMLILLLAAFASADEGYVVDNDFEPLDFRGIKWLENLDDIRGMKVLYREDDGSETICSRKGDDLRLGGAELSSIEYIFLDGKLSAVSVVAEGEQNQEALLDEAKSMFGRETVNAGDDFMWRFKDVMVMYSKELEEQSVLFYKHIGFLNK